MIVRFPLCFVGFFWKGCWCLFSFVNGQTNRWECHFRYSLPRASDPDLVIFAGLWYLLDLWTYIWYFCRYYLLLFFITISFSDASCLIRLSYIFPQCQPLHYGYTPGNVYLFTGPLEARKIQRCSCLWCFFTILVVSIAANAQLLENASHQPVRMNKCLLCILLPSMRTNPAVTWIRPTSEKNLGPSHRCLVTCMNLSLSQQTNGCVRYVIVGSFALGLCLAALWKSKMAVLLLEEYEVRLYCGICS